MWLHGIHLSESPNWDPAVGALFGDRPGWVLVLAELGHSPTDMSGTDYTQWSRRGYEVVVRFQHGWGTAGCIPIPTYYDAYVQRIMNFIAASSGCHIWQLGNEMNVEAERPDGKAILPTDYASLYDKVKTMLLALPGHENDKLLIGAVGPWNVKTPYGGNETGNWVYYLRDIIKALKTRADGLTIHTYTHGSSLSGFDSAPMNAPFEKYDYNFLSFRDWFQVIPLTWEDRLFLITETDQNDPWLNQNNGWLQKAYQTVDDWNHISPFVVSGMLPYRLKDDKWEFASKPGVQAMLKEVVAIGYTVEEEKEPKPMPVSVWKEIHKNSCELGFYDQDGVGELTVPVGTHVHWIQGSAQGDFNRVEADAKNKSIGHPEVYEGVYSAALMWRSSTGSAALVSDPIYIEAGKSVRGSCIYQHIIDGGNGGARMGIVVSGPTDPFGQGKYSWLKTEASPFNADCIAWGGWQSTYGKLANRVWVKLTTPEVVPSGAYIRFICQFNSDDRANSSAGIFDVMTVEQYTDSPAPPVTPPVTPPADPTVCNGVSATKLAAAFEAAAAVLRA